MLFALEFDEEVSARSYLKELLKCYPYDIEETMVLSLLTKNPFPDSKRKCTGIARIFFK